MEICPAKVSEVIQNKHCRINEGAAAHRLTALCGKTLDSFVRHAAQPTLMWRLPLSQRRNSGNSPRPPCIGNFFKVDAHAGFRSPETHRLSRAGISRRETPEPHRLLPTPPPPFAICHLAGSIRADSGQRDFIAGSAPVKTQRDRTRSRAQRSVHFVVVLLRRLQPCLFCACEDVC